MSIDKLAEDYSYQSPYNFAENRVMDGRELEGLEWRSSTSSDGKTVSLSLNVRTVNNTSGILSNKQMAILANERASQLSSSLGGKDSQGRNVNVSVTYNNKATISWEYSAGNDTSDRTYTTNSSKELGDQMAPGLTDKIGDTQNNRTQVNMGNTAELSSDGKLGDKTDTSGLAVTGAHEDLHTVGLKHSDDKTNTNSEAQKKDSKNIMNYQYGDGVGKTNVTPDQRTQVINLIEKQQPKQ